MVSKAGECCSAKTLRSCAGPWGRLVIASHWGEEEKLEHSLPLAPNLGDDELAAALVVSLLRRSDSRGSDIRLDTGVPFVARAWPRVTVDPQRWRWQTCRAWEFKKPQHINELELQALVGLMKWRGRRLDSFGKRFLVLVDSQVVLAVVCKGRSSARRLARILLRFNALVLATHCRPLFAFVRSAENPADAPSRKFEK